MSKDQGPNNDRNFNFQWLVESWEILAGGEEIEG